MGSKEGGSRQMGQDEGAAKAVVAERGEGVVGAGEEAEASANAEAASRDFRASIDFLPSIEFRGAGVSSKVFMGNMSSWALVKTAGLGALAAAACAFAKVLCNSSRSTVGTEEVVHQP